MGSILASAITGQAAADLGDPSNTYWTQSELLSYLNEAQGAAVLLRPEVNPVNDKIVLAAGSVQSLPEDGYILLDVIRNSKAVRMADADNPGDFLAPAIQIGLSVTATEKKNLDGIDRSWHTPEQGATLNTYKIRNYVYDVRNRKTWYAYPAVPDYTLPGSFDLNNLPTPSSAYQVPLADIVYSKIPEAIANTDPITLDDVYHPALLAYVMHRARVKDIAIVGQGPEQSMTHYNKFFTLITGESENENQIIIRSEQKEGE